MPGLLIVFLVSVVLSLALVLLARATHRHHNIRGAMDVETAYVTSICTLYGIFLAFMIFTVWSRYDQARINTVIEANTVAEIFHLAGGLQEPMRTEWKALSLDYARSVIAEEWRTMRRGRPSPDTEGIVHHMWSLANRTTEAHDDVLRDHLLTSYTELTDHRRTRLLWSATGLSEYAYVVLFLGALITVGMSAIFIVEDFRTHFLKAAALAAMIGIMLATVWVLGHPFRGAVGLEPTPFVEVIERLD